jgi:predicted Zn-dependent protease
MANAFGSLRPLIIGLVVLASSSCATTQQSPVKALWLHPLQDHWTRVANTGVNLIHRDGSKRFVSAPIIRNVVTAKERIEQVSGVKAELGLVDTDFPNAFAFHHQGRPVIAISLSWLDQLGQDPDAIATTLGHELAHLHLGHGGAARKERQDAARSASQVLILNLAGVPMGGTIANIGVTAFARSFTRDEERAADDLGIRWASTAGYDPCGKAHVVKMYQRIRSGSLDIPFLSTHPSYGERSDVANEYSRKVRNRPCDD